MHPSCLPTGQYSLRTRASPPGQTWQSVNVDHLGSGGPARPAGVSPSWPWRILTWVCG